jgi:hypothetical protein
MPSTAAVKEMSDVVVARDVVARDVDAVVARDVEARTSSNQQSLVKIVHFSK